MSYLTPREVAKQLREEDAAFREDRTTYLEVFDDGDPDDPYLCIGCALGKLFYHQIRSCGWDAEQEVDYLDTADQDTIYQELEAFIPSMALSLIDDIHAGNWLQCEEIADVLDACADWDAFYQAYDYALGREVIV